MAITSNFFGLRLFDNMYSTTNDIGVNINLQLTYTDPIFTVYDKSNLVFILENNITNTTNEFNYILDKYYGYSTHNIPIKFNNFLTNELENNILEVIPTNNSSFTLVDTNLINNYTYYLYLNYFIDGVEHSDLLSSYTFDTIFFDYNTNLHSNINYLKDKYAETFHNLSNNLNYIDVNLGIDTNLILYLNTPYTVLNFKYYDKYGTNYNNLNIDVNYSGIGYYNYLLKDDIIDQRCEYIMINNLRLNIIKKFNNSEQYVYVANFDTRFNNVQNIVFDYNYFISDINSKKNILKNKYIINDTNSITDIEDIDNSFNLNYDTFKVYEKSNFKRFELNTGFLANENYLDEKFKELFLSKNIKLKEYTVEVNSAVTYYNGEPVEIIGKLIDFTNLTAFTGDVDNIYVDDKWLINAAQDNWISIFNVLPVITTPTTVNLRLRYYYENVNSPNIRLYYFWNTQIYRILYLNDLQNGVDIGGGMKEINTIITGYTYNQVAQFRIEALILSGDIDLYIDEVAVIYTGITQDVVVEYYDKLIPTCNEYDVYIVDNNYILQNEYNDTLISYNVVLDEKNKNTLNYDIK